VAPPQKEPVDPVQSNDEAELPYFFFVTSSNDSEFDEWNEVFIFDTEDEAAEEVAQCGTEERFQRD
jgi:hypothetical protein